MHRSFLLFLRIINDCSLFFAPFSKAISRKDNNYELKRVWHILCPLLNYYTANSCEEKYHLYILPILCQAHHKNDRQQKKRLQVRSRIHPSRVVQAQAPARREVRMGIAARPNAVRAEAAAAIAAAAIQAITAHRRTREANRRRAERAEILPARAISQAQAIIPEPDLRGLENFHGHNRKRAP
jgi:hypothetical protein